MSFDKSNFEKTISTDETNTTKKQEQVKKELAEAIEHANFHHYSKPMSVVNIKSLQLPIPIWLTTVEDKNHEFHIRLSHGIPHVIPAMELIDKIHAIYTKYVDNYFDELTSLATEYNIDSVDLLKLVQIAVIFHDSAREGDGMDLWDEQSAAACLSYLKKKQISDSLSHLISDAIKYKDDAEEFEKIHGKKAKYIRELVNMADALEVLRTRDNFEPIFLPIDTHVKPKVMVENIIPELVVGHRSRIIDEGRLKRKARIIYKKTEGQHTYEFDDTDYKPRPGRDYKKVGKTYKQQCEKYCLAVLEIKQENLDMVVEKVLRGIKLYQRDYNKSGLQWFHNGIFSPRFHGAIGRARSAYYAHTLSTDNRSQDDKIKIIYALLASGSGKTLQESVLRSFNQHNKELIMEQLNNLLIQLDPNYDKSEIDCIMNDAEQFKIK